MKMAEAGVRIFDKGMAQPVTVPGVLIGKGSSRRDDSLAWAEIEIYKLEDGSYRTHRVGYSLTYHLADTRCTVRSGAQKGDPATVDDLPDDAEPCTVCRPPEPRDLGDDEPVRYEFPRHSFDGCADPAQVIEKLTVFRDRKHQQSVRFSGPVMAALREAARNDPAFQLETPPDAASI
jgi:hypothetical protein